MESYREKEQNLGASSTEISTVVENSPTKGSSSSGNNLLQ
jgi:hypothetical protein